VDQPSHRVPNNYGLVSVTDATHPHHTELLTEINARLVGIKAGVIDPADDPKTGQLLILQKRA
jgi:hypothetical protein